MYSDDFEQAFSDFLDRTEYDEAANMLFSLARDAFFAGWKAAKGEPLPASKIIYLLHKPEKEQ